MKKLLLFMSIVALTFVGCNNDDDKTMGPNNTIVGFTSPSTSSSFLNNVDDAELLVPVTLISYVNEQLPTQDISLSWQIVESTAADAATPGVEFDLPSGGSGVVVIPAGQTTASISLNVHPSSFDAFNPKKVTLLLTNASNGIVGKQYEKIEVTLQAVCVSEIAGNYNLSVSIIAGNGVGTSYSLPGEVLTQIGTARFKGNSIGPYNSRGLISPNAQIAGIGLVIDDTCGNITLWQDPDWAFATETGVPNFTAQFLGNFYNAVYQNSALAANSFVNETTGVITVEYFIWFSAGTRTYRAIYTPV